MMRSLLRRVPPEVAHGPLEAGDLVGLVPVDRYYPGEAAVAVLPSGRAREGVLLLLGGAWWLLTDAGGGLEELIALGPGIAVFRALVFRPL